MKLLYAIVYAGWYLLSLLPLRVLYVISDGLYFLLYKVGGYRRKVVRKNLTSSFPEKSEAEIRHIEHDFYHFFCDLIVESVKLMTIRRENMKRRMVLKGTEIIAEVVEKGQSCVIYTGHYCNWEWITPLPLWLTPKAKMGLIYHPVENPEFDRLFLHMRGRFGTVCIPMQDTLRTLIEYNRNHQPMVIGFVSDQKPHWVNIHHWVDFLHHDTPVVTGTERIVKKLNYAAVYLDVRRVRRGYYEGEFRLLTSTPKDMPDYALTDAYFTCLEQTIQRDPAFWLWSHDRWARTREEFNERFEVINGKVVAKESVEG